MIDFDKFYRKNFKVQVNVINKCVKDRELAEDIVQEAYTRAIIYQSSFREDKSTIKTWFNKIMFNVLHDTTNLNSKLDEQEITDELITPDPAYERNEENLNLIQKEIDEIYNEDHSFILYLFYILGYRTDEIIKVVDVTQTQITSACFRFKKKLLDKYGFDI